MTDTTAAQIIARARESWTNNPDTDGSLDTHIAAVGLRPYGELYQEVYAAANEGHTVTVGCGQAQLDQRKERAARLWQQLLPELEAYTDGCRNAGPAPSDGFNIDYYAEHVDPDDAGYLFGTAMGRTDS